MNSEFQRLPLETQEAVKKTMDTMEPAQTPAEIRETLEGTQKGGVKNSIRNCLTVFQRDPLFRGALRLNLLTEQIDIVKPLGWERTSTTLTDMDMNYLLLYLEENYGLTSEKKVQSAIKIVANENRYHPVRDYLNSLQWDGTERKEVKQRKEFVKAKRAIYKLITSNPKVTTAQIADKLNVSTRQVQKYLKRLTEQNLIVKEGSRINGSWKILDEEYTDFFGRI